MKKILNFLKSSIKYILIFLCGFMFAQCGARAKDTLSASADASTVAADTQIDYDGMTIDPFQYPTANLLNWPYAKNSGKMGSVDILVNNDGTLLLNGTLPVGSGSSSFAINTKNIYFFPGARYTISLSLLDGEVSIPAVLRCTLTARLTDGSDVSLTGSNYLTRPTSFLVPENAKFLYIYIWFGSVQADVVFDNVKLGIMYNQGATAYPYQPPYQLVYANGYNNGADSSYNSGYDKGLQDGAAIAQRGIFNGLYADCNVFYYDENNNYTNKRFDVNPTFSTNTALFSNIVLDIEHQDPDIYEEKIEQIDIIFRYKSGTFPLVKDFKFYMLGSYGVFGGDDYHKEFTITTSSGDLTCEFVEPEEYLEQGARIMQITENQSIVQNAQVYSIGTFTLYRGQTGKFTLQSYNESGYGAGYDAGYSAGENNFKNSQEYKDALKDAQDKGIEQGKLIGYENAVGEGVDGIGIFYSLIAIIKILFKLLGDCMTWKIAGDLTIGLFVIGIPATFMIINLVIRLVKGLAGGGGNSE